MKEIRTKPISKTPRILSKAAQLPKEIIHKSAQQTRNIANQENVDESPQHYAENRAQEAAQRTGQKVKEGGVQAGKKIRQIVTRKNRMQPRNTPKAKNTKSANISSSVKRTERATRRTAQAVEKTARNATKHTAKGTVKSIRRTVKAARNTVKTSRRVVKTAKVAVKTARVAVKTVQATIRAARIAAKAAITAAKIAVKVTIAIVKAIIAAVKALVAAIAAGGWIAVLIILIVAVIVLIVGSALGIFFADDSGGLSVSDTITQVNEDFTLAIDTQVAALSSGGNYDKVNVIYDGNMDGDSDTVNNWKDVLIVFASKSMVDGQPPVVLTPESKAELQNIFYTMNSVSYRTQIVQDQEKKNILNIFVTVTSKAWQEGADIYAFDNVKLQKKWNALSIILCLRSCSVRTYMVILRVAI